MVSILERYLQFKFVVGMREVFEGLQLAKELLLLTDIEKYKKLKRNNSSLYRKTVAFIFKRQV